MKKIVTFTASWCGPCKMIKPVLQKLADEGSIVWENHDIDENQALAASMEIKSVPTLLFYEGDVVYRRESGYIPAEKILNIYGVEV